MHSGLTPLPTVPHVVVGCVACHGGQALVALTDGAGTVSLILQEPTRAGTVQADRRAALELVQLLLQAIEAMPPT